MSKQQAVDMTVLPLMGYVFTFCVTEIFKTDYNFINEVDQPKWVVHVHWEWYKPAFCVVTALAGFGSYLVWSTGKLDNLPNPTTDTALTVYYLQMVLFWLYYPGLEYFRSLPISTLMISSTSVIAIVTTAKFWRIRKIAGCLMVPYLIMLAYHVTWNVYMFTKEDVSKPSSLKK
uniref:Translocator protein n=1 Tax=Lygus hesperus TaxID=30085 RepID=A0A0A9Z984_LYGHE